MPIMAPRKAGISFYLVLIQNLGGSTIVLTPFISLPDFSLPTKAHLKTKKIIEVASDVFELRSDIGDVFLESQKYQGNNSKGRTNEQPHFPFRFFHKNFHRAARFPVACGTKCPWTLWKSLHCRPPCGVNVNWRSPCWNSWDVWNLRVASSPVLSMACRYTFFVPKWLTLGRDRSHKLCTQILEISRMHQTGTGLE